MFASLFINHRSGKYILGLATAMLLSACGGGPTSQVPVRKAPIAQETSDKNVVQKSEALDDQAALPPDGAADDQEILIAIMLPLSGPEANTGKALLRAATIALFDAYDPRLKLIPFDTQADAVIAAQQAREAVAQGVAVVLGPLLSDSVAAAGPVFQQANITMIGFSNDSNVAAPGRFIMGFLPETEVKRVIDYAVEQGLSEFGALIPEGLYGSRVQIAFGDTVVDASARVIAIENYSPGSPDTLVEPVKRLARYDERRREARREIQFLRGLRDDLTNEIAQAIEEEEVMEGVAYDAVLLPEGGAMMRSLAPLLPFYEVDPNTVKLLGTGLWNDTGLLGEPPMQGGWFAAPEPARPDAFLQRFEDAYGAPAPRLATLAYDAFGLIAEMARASLPEDSTLDADATEATLITSINKTVQPRHLFAADRLTGVEGFVGIDGLFRFLPDGKIERGLAILEVNRGGFVIKDAAPASFPAFGYILN